MISLNDWQVGIRKYAKSKGFNWTKADIDTMLLRIISELCEAAEAARDIPITKKIHLEFMVTNKDYPNGITLGTNIDVDMNDDTFQHNYEAGLWKDRQLKIEIKGYLIEDFESDEHVAEELADVFIRLADTTKVLGIDLEKEVLAKHTKNLDRPPKHGRGRK